MNKEKNIENILNHLKNTEGEGFEFDEEAIHQEYEKKDENKSSLSIKILSILGGFFASITFVAFLFIAGLYESYSIKKERRIRNERRRLATK